ncbi:MAG: DUF6691 family protein [Flavobacteriaceae bacterium]
MKIFTALLSGIVFGIGIAISGMGNPAKVLNFFDPVGSWDPSLLLVMGGALVTTFIGYRLLFRLREKPLAEPSFAIPVSRRIDARLIGGSAVFGIGWGITGFCPGGAVPVLAIGYWEPLVFVLAMMVGIFLAMAADRLIKGRSRPVPLTDSHAARH